MNRRQLFSLLLTLLPLAGCAGGKEVPEPFAASFPGRDPRLLWDAAGRLHVAYVESLKGGTAAVAYRRLGRAGLGPVRVSPPGLDIAASAESPPTLDRLPDGTLVIGYPVKLPGKWSSELRVQRSTDGGRTWGEPRLLHPAEDGAHSFLSSALSASGTLAFAWLDKSSGAMGLRTASTRDGETFSPPATVDARTCQCCGTAMATGQGERLWLAYRDLEADDLRDFRVLRSATDPPAFRSGAKLSADSWKINGCPETGARLAADPAGNLWAAWFTAGGEPGLYVTSSLDGGRHFARRTLLTPPGRPGRHPEIGVLPNGRIVLLYEMFHGEKAAVEARIRDRQGAWSEPRALLPEGTYPRFASRGSRTAVAVTRSAERDPQVVVEDWQDLLAAEDE